MKTLNTATKTAKSNTFALAHKMAKTFVGSYRACFALALRILNRSKVKAVTVEVKTNTQEKKPMLNKLTDGMLHVFTVAVMVAVVAFGYCSHTASEEVKEKYHSTTNCVSNTCLTKDGEYIRYDKTFGFYEIVDNPGVEIALKLQLGAKGTKTN